MTTQYFEDSLKEFVCHDYLCPLLMSTSCDSLRDWAELRTEQRNEGQCSLSFLYAIHMAAGSVIAVPSPL